jgi:hypothetical protein
MRENISRKYEDEEDQMDTIDPGLAHIHDRQPPQQPPPTLATYTSRKPLALLPPPQPLAILPPPQEQTLNTTITNTIRKKEMNHREVISSLPTILTVRTNR